MTTFRSRILAAFLFALISLGQAYPFSVAWGMSQSSHPCHCHTAAATPCKCDHDHKPSKKKKFSCHKQEEKFNGPQYSKAPCGSKTQAASLNFRGENCLPRFHQEVPLPIESVSLENFNFPFPEFFSVPEPPPPKWV